MCVNYDSLPHSLLGSDARNGAFDDTFQRDQKRKHQLFILIRRFFENKITSQAGLNTILGKDGLELHPMPTLFKSLGHTVVTMFM